MNWATIIALVALAFSIICFWLFVIDATKKQPPAEVADQVRSKVMAEAKEAPTLDPRIFGELAKALAAAFAKIGPGLVALIGSILFLLLSGEAAQVYNLTGSASATNAIDTADEQEDGAGKNEAEQADGNSGETGSDFNAADNSE